MRRLLAGAATVGLVLAVALAPATQAQESIPAAYAGSKITTPASVDDTSSPKIEALFVRKFNRSFQNLQVRTWITVPGGLPGGCGSAGEVELPTETGDGTASGQIVSKATASTPCNGTYGIRVEGTLRNNLGGAVQDRATLIGQVTVAVKPPAVSGVEAASDGSSINLTWNGVSPEPKDLTGYRIQRQDGDGWTTLGEVGPNATSYSAGPPPAEGGRITYRVLATRNGPGEDDITCECGGKTTIEVAASGTTTTVPGGGGGGTGGDGGGTGGGATGGGGTGGGATGGGDTGGTTGGTGGGKKPPRGGRTFTALPRGQVGVGTKAPRLGVATGANVPDLLTGDEGFDEEIDYGDLGGGEDEEDGLSSFYYEGAGGRGMAIPVATGFVLFAWAVHLRYLARAAKPVPAAGAAAKRKRSSRPAQGRHGRSTRGSRGPARERRDARGPETEWIYR